jgi:hypothetical protein
MTSQSRTGSGYAGVREGNRFKGRIKALAEGHLTRRRFGAMPGRIALLPIPTG